MKLVIIAVASFLLGGFLGVIGMACLVASRCGEDDD